MKKQCNLPDENEMADLAELFKVFGDSTRIRILFTLFDDEQSVTDIAEALNMTTSAVSHQLRILIMPPYALSDPAYIVLDRVGL